MKSLRHIPGVAICCMVAAFSSVSVASAATIHVYPGETIASGLAAAVEGDTVLVHCGTYLEQGLQMPDDVTLRSETGDPDCVVLASDGSETILSCILQSGTPHIEGITFTTANPAKSLHPARGGGMLIWGAGPTVLNCVFRGLAADYGGAIYLAGGGAGFGDCVFADNVAQVAGGAVNCVGDGGIDFYDCLFFGNETVGWGEVLNVASGYDLRLYSSTLADNGAGAADIVGWDATTFDLAEAIVTTDSAWLGDRSTARLFTCVDLFSTESDPWRGLLADMAGQNGNISADPLFCGAAGGELPYSLDAASPCAAGASFCPEMGAFGVGCAVSDVPDDPQQTIPQMTQLRGNFPNPFNPSTTIRYDVKQAGTVDLAVFDVAGRLVKRLVSEVRGAGSHEVVWRGRDRDDRQVAAGVYFVRLKVGSLVDTSRLSLIK